MDKTVLRTRFEKTGRAVYISHLDLMRTLVRAFRRTDIPFWYTEGFTPRVYLDFPLPLPLGVTGLSEFFDFAVLGKPSETAENGRKYAETLNLVLPEGIKILDIAPPVYERTDISSADYEIKMNGITDGEVCDFLSREIIEAKKFSKKSGEKTIDLKPFIKNTKIVCEKETTLFINLPAGNKLNINTSVLTNALKNFVGGEPEITSETRLRLLLENGKEFV
jgi:radical SAM-linked protein